MIMLYVSDQENKKLENMTTQYTDNYVSIIWEDRTYIHSVPLTIVKKEYKLV